MRVARLVITGRTMGWAREAAVKLTGFATSVIGCKCEAGIERELSDTETPDGRPGVSVLFLTMDKASLPEQLIVRVGQTVLTCATTACFDGLPDAPDRLPVGKALRVFGDGFQASKLIGGKRYWRIPVMEGEFLIEETFGMMKGVGSRDSRRVPARRAHDYGGELRREARAPSLLLAKDSGMSDAVTLSLTTPPEHALVADCITADRLAALGEKEIGELPVLHGGRAAHVGDFFRVTGGRSGTVRLEGDLSRAEGIGARMAGGELVIEGHGGRDLGVAMSGGRIDVHGDAGENTGGALPGAGRGMTGGEIVIRGSVGLFGKAGPGTGRFLKRGWIVALGEVERPATFRYACTYHPLHVALLLRYVGVRCRVDVTPAQVAGRDERYSGDLAELGRGELLRWVGGGA